MGRSSHSLRAYVEKRDFRRTSEPRGRSPKARAAAPIFCVQRHLARRAHFDLRLEIDGVLKSWALPKRPTLDPEVVRLAIPTEDHPIEYARFEGIIPKGEYGAGRVTVWDSGTYRTVSDSSEALARGHLHLDLDGEKLQGAFVLVRTGERSWIFRKVRDEYAIQGQLDEERERDWEPMPMRPSPALCRLVDRPPEGEAWIHEIKLDGYRILARVAGNDVRLISRSGSDYGPKAPSIREALRKLPDGIYDGELVVYDEEGRTKFDALVESLSRPRSSSIRYAVFDLLYLVGRDLRGLPLLERKALLERSVAEAGLHEVEYVDHVVGKGDEFFEAACGAALEGVVSKRIDAPYRAGRSGRFLKSRCGQRQELVVVGFTPHANEPEALGALLLAVMGRDGPKYAGKVGTGFSMAARKALRAELEPLEVAGAPRAMDEPREGTRHAHWVRPEVVVEVRFSNWTRDGRLRHPVFMGVRNDKAARDVVRERARPTVSVALSNPEKVLYPRDGITKRDLAEHFARVATRMLPHVIGRPLTLLRCPNGLEKCWYQKHPSGSVPEGLERVSIEGSKGRSHYLVARREIGLEGLAQLGALEAHIWGSRADRLERPDRMVFDLDPDLALGFGDVVRAAEDLRDTLASLDLTSFALLTGGKGIHVVVPLDRYHEFDAVKRFSRTVATRLSKDAPDRFVATASKRLREGKIFIDYLRNGRSATSVAPYSTRAREGAPVAMPVKWSELEAAETASKVGLREVAERLDADDPWLGYFEVRQRITKRALGRLGGTSLERGFP